MSEVGNGVLASNQYADALIVREAELSTLRRVGARIEHILIVQGNLANTYDALKRNEDAIRMRRDVYSGHLRLHGEEHYDTLREANNLANSFAQLQRFEEAKSLLRKTIPVAWRVLGETSELMHRMKKVYADTLYMDPTATLDDLREAVTTLEETEPLARRVLGGVHPLTVDIERELRSVRAVLRARESGDVASIREGVAAMTARDA